MAERGPLLMIPGPIEVSPAVQAAYAVPPPGHLAPKLIEAFGRSLEMMREVWRADPSSQPFLVPGSGTTAMEMAATNVVGIGETVVVVKTGYFSDRMEKMLHRLGAAVVTIEAAPGDAPPLDAVAQAVEELRDKDVAVKALFATHVDTSTGVRIDPAPLARIAREHGALSVFDGVCATAAERFEMAAWEADVYLTASQKALGLPPGLALVVASARAMDARAVMHAAEPPLVLDFESWLPIMKAYEARKPAYFATPATNLVLALEAGLREILEEGMEARFAAHERAAFAMRAAWRAMGLAEIPVREGLLATTLSAIRYPAGVDAALVGRIGDRGVTVAGGLHPLIRNEYFRVGHMGYAAGREEMLRATVEAVEGALIASGVGLTPGSAAAAFRASWGR